MGRADLTVLMAVRNGGAYLRAAVESILDQTFTSFDFLIIDDASTDETAQIVRSYSDSRIRLLSLAENVGQTVALNRGLRDVSTTWIARMDADDYSAPNRFEQQMALLRRDTGLGCVGTFAWFFRDDPHERSAILSRPVTHEAIVETLLWASPIIHGTIIANTRAILDAGGYDERYRYAADLDLYDRLLMKSRAQNIPEPLLGIRRHPGQDSHSKRGIQESIQILSRRLCTSRYTPREAAVIRSAKCLHEALCARIDHNYMELLKRVAGAFWFSPATTLRHFRPGPVL